MDDDKDKTPGKPKVFKIVVSNLYMTKTGWRTSSNNVITKDGYESFLKKYGDI
jgi:hypothetical protein